MPDDTESDREKCSKYICIEYDQSRDLSLEQESCRQVDEANITDEPEKTCPHHHTDLLIYRRIIAELIESSTGEYDRPEYHARYDEWDELFVRDIWYPQLDKRDTVRDATKCVCQEKHPCYHRQFDDRREEYAGDLSFFHEAIIEKHKKFANRSVANIIPI
jgi:hypothetical protein